ncbi:MAG: DNA replication/repair protein RecF [Nitriliruptorales bacterium]|nr:DNA replication/repair protein RecF [Nitriliruptorales bacterium]
MRLENLELVDFRSYREARIVFGPGVRVLIGANAQGKTNVLESVQYLATGGSHRVATDVPLVRAGAEAAVIRAEGQSEGRRFLVELELRPGGRSRARINGQPRPRVREAIGRVRAVLFAPEDLSLVRGDPSDRRRFLDDLLGQRRPAYLAARQEYERALRQRTALLRSLRGGRQGTSDLATLDTWTQVLIQTGATLLAARIAAVHALSGPAGAAYQDLVASSPAREAEGAVQLDYLLSTGRTVAGRSDAGIPDLADLVQELRAGLDELSDAERERGVTLVGPHRDDLVLGLNDLPAKSYASQGEAWSLALALRLASREVIAETGPEPIVLLDDVFAELDELRRSRLAARCAAFEQVLVTAAVDDDVPLAGPRYFVRAGTVTTDPSLVDLPDVPRERS